MNSPRSFEPAQDLDSRLAHDALAALQEKAELKGQLVMLDSVESGHYRRDAALDLKVENGTERYLVEFKHSVDRKAQLDGIRRQFASLDKPGVLVAPYITRELAEHCRSTGLQFLDSCGNAYLRAPGLFVYITGERSERGQRSFAAPKGLTNAATLRVVFAMLVKPDLASAPFKGIARVAGVSLGTAHNVLKDLERRGYLIQRGETGRRQLLERRRLLDEWTLNFPTTLRSKLNGRRFRAPAPEWWKDAELSLDCVWGSEVAAMKMTGYLKPATQSLYVPPAEIDSVTTALVKRYRLRPDREGEFELLEKFWPADLDTTPGLAPAVLVHAELLALLDPRTDETANMIRERFIDPTFDQA